MLDVLKQHFFQCFINIICSMYIISSLVNIKFNFKKYKNYFIIVLLVMISIFVFIYSNNLLRLLPMTCLVFIGNYILYHQSIKITLVSSLFEQLIVVISEILAFFVISLITNLNVEQIRLVFYGNPIYVIFISILMISISKLSITKKFYQLFLDKIEYLNTFKLTVYSIIIIISISFLIAGNFLEVEFKKLFLVSIFLIIVYCLILYYAIKKNNENIKYKLKNKILLDNLNEYEKMLDYQRVNNHENKNQLLVIKSMLEKSDDKVIKYINEIIKEKREDNDIMYTKAKMIPSGGLQGLIYQKMLVMQDNNIEVILDVNKQVRKIDLTNISSKMNYDICRIIGIILDNAIDETIKFNKNEREIIISMYVDDLFCIEISNRIKENIDMNKIYDKGFTTKENGHGYGLSLLRKIVNANEEIFNDIKIINDVFTQIVKIKM